LNRLFETKPGADNHRTRNEVTLQSYTRRRFFGRQPLCGIGVMSRIAVIEIPAPCNARKADSRPDPGPFRNTAALLSPTSFAASAARLAATCAANGVDFLDPLNPLQPELDHDMTPPVGSVIVTTVLLKVALMKTIPAGTFFDFALRFLPPFLSAPCAAFAPVEFPVVTDVP